MSEPHSRVQAPIIQFSVRFGTYMQHDCTGYIKSRALKLKTSSCEYLSTKSLDDNWNGKVTVVHNCNDLSAFIVSAAIARPSIMTKCSPVIAIPRALRNW